VNLRKDH